MIKKFKEFVEDVSYGITPKRNIRDTIPDEEVEDQFLRLKEVMGCDIRIFTTLESTSDKNLFVITTGEIISGFWISVCVNDNPSNNPRRNTLKVKDELKLIKLRMESQYPKLEITIDEPGDDYDFEIWISEKNQKGDD